LDNSFLASRRAIASATKHTTESNGAAATPPPPPPSVAPAPGTRTSSSIFVTDTVDGATYPLVPVPRDQTVRESMIKKHFESKIQQLHLQLQRADGTAQKYKSLLTKLQIEVDSGSSERTRLELALQKANQDIVDIKDRLVTTEKNYSSQLNMMTEHIFTLNSQLTAQQEELDRRHSRPGAPAAAAAAAAASAATTTAARRVRN